MSLLSQYRELASALAFFVLMMLVFTIASPSVWLNSLSYTAVFISLPIYIILAVSLVFVVVAGEIDLSFASVVGVAALVFSEFVLAAGTPICAWCWRIRQRRCWAHQRLAGGLFRAFVADRHVRDELFLAAASSRLLPTGWVLPWRSYSLRPSTMCSWDRSASSRCRCSGRLALPSSE